MKVEETVPKENLYWQFTQGRFCLFVIMNIGDNCRELKQALLPFFGNNFSRIILFGSYPRNDFSDESDLDFLIVLKNPEINSNR